ncbi:hypothetical protein [Promicromonospora sp. NPDC050880]|uniref:hypothetical protein n=1 Tax=Promicromonospora sp. NPDC050880 TaxID=3364406 RepID=UPI00379D2AF1
MRKITVLGASALLVAGLVGAPAAAFAAPIAGAPVAITGGEQTCPKEGKVDITEGEPTSITVSAPEGYLISGYCVKAGSAKQGLGPEYIEVDPPASEVTITHSSGKAISHYTLVTVKAEPTPTPSTPGEEPSPEPTVPTDQPTVPGDEPTDATVLPGGDASDDASTAPAGDAPEELAATGASTAIGVTLIALALVGGGVTLIVLRRKGVLGS